MKFTNIIRVLLIILPFALGNAFATSKVNEVYAASAISPIKQHFVLVHGGWHGAWSWYQVKTKLESIGHEVTVVDLPAHGIDATNPKQVTLNDYANKVISLLDASPTPVVLVGHSMGGLVISTVAEARPRKVAKLVYLAAFLLPNGKTLVDIASGDTQSLVTPNLVINGPDGFVDINRSSSTHPELLREMFYGLSPKNDSTLAKSLLKPNPLAPFLTPMSTTPGNFGIVRRFYIKTLQDRAISPSVQESMIAALPCEKVYQINSDHSPFFSRPDELVLRLLQIAFLR